MEITRANFQEEIVNITDNLKRSSFVGFDAEFTAILSGESFKHRLITLDWVIKLATFLHSNDFVLLFKLQVIWHCRRALWPLQIKCGPHDNDPSGLDNVPVWQRIWEVHSFRLYIPSLSTSIWWCWSVLHIPGFYTEVPL